MVGFAFVLLCEDDWLPSPRSALAPVAWGLLPWLWFAVVFSFCEDAFEDFRFWLLFCMFIWFAILLIRSLLKWSDF